MSETLFQRTISTSIQINASPMDVWAALTNLNLYPAWNPHIREGSGAVATGAKLRLRMYPPNGRPVTLRPTVIVAEPGVELRLLGALPGIFSGEHIFTLHAVDGGTLVIQSERYSGLLVPLMGKAIAASLASFEAHNSALKRWVETH